MIDLLHYKFSSTWNQAVYIPRVPLFYFPFPLNERLLSILQYSWGHRTGRGEVGGVECQAPGAAAVRAEGVTGLHGSQLWDLASPGAWSVLCVRTFAGDFRLPLLCKNTRRVPPQGTTLSVEVLCKCNYQHELKVLSSFNSADLLNG